MSMFKATRRAFAEVPKALPNVFFDVKAGETSLGRIEFKLYDDIVPKTATNFRTLATGGHRGGVNNAPLTYKGVPFHRVIRRFMLQGGDILARNGSGTVSIYGRSFPDENFVVKHSRPGLLSMANAGPNTNGSQFFITTVPTPHLDGKHVVFGEVVKGMEVVHAIEDARTDGRDKPLVNIFIDACGEVKPAETL